MARSNYHGPWPPVGAKPPYVLVGHSWGGLLVRMFVEFYPSEVAGLVYIDPTDLRSMAEEEAAQYVIAVFEILGGLGVLIPRWRRAASAILVALMIGALCTHAVQGEFPRLIPPLVLGGLAFLLYSSRLRPGGEQAPRRGIGV